MNGKYIYPLLLLLIFVSCEEDSEITPPPSKPTPGFSITNGPRQGSIYLDSNGTTYTYRYISSVVSNDSTLPMRIKIDFAAEGAGVSDTIKSTVFLTPRNQLTSGVNTDRRRLEAGSGVPQELQWFLEGVGHFEITLDTVLAPNGKCTLGFGILTDIKYTEPYGIGLKALSEDSKVTKLGLTFDNYVIPCGSVLHLPH